MRPCHLRSATWPKQTRKPWDYINKCVFLRMLGTKMCPEAAETLGSKGRMRRSFRFRVVAIVKVGAHGEVWLRVCLGSKSGRKK